jgi:hypothetical protein
MMALFGGQQRFIEQRDYDDVIEVSYSPHQMRVSFHLQHSWPAQGQKREEKIGQRQTQQRPGQRLTLRPPTSHQQNCNQTQTTEQSLSSPCQKGKTNSVVTTATAKPMFALLSEKQTLVPHLLTLKWGSGTKHQPDK